jgi:hypothetical protein
MEEPAMSETTTEATKTEPTTDQTQGEPAADEQLGEGGKKALDAERNARKAAEKAATDLQAQLDKINRANESAVEKAQRELKEAQDDAAKARAEAIRLRVAAKHGISDEDADLFLTATDEDSLNRQAERLTARNAEATSPRSPKPDANQGRSGAAGPKTTADSFAEFFRNNLPER